MQNPITVTCAPCCWGVDDVKNPHLPPWERVLDEAAAAGFGGLELGPYGYMPLDVARVGAALDARGLRIVAGTIFDDLVNPANRENLLRQTDEICAFITALPRPRSHRGPALPGAVPDGDGLGPRRARLRRRPLRPRAAPRSPTPGPAWSRTSAPSPNSRATATASAPSSTRMPAATSSSRTSSTGSRPTCRPNLPGFASTPATSTIPGWTRSRRSGAYADRLDYIHFKDIDPAVYADVMGRRIRFFEACGEGVMCPIGRGRIDYPGLRRLLTELGYGGYITIEQERDPRNTGGILADLAASRTFLRNTGF